jgi:hypothetical protein
LRWGRGKDVVKAKYSVTMPLRIEVENLIFCERRKGEKRGKREKTLSGLTKYMGGVVVALSKLVSPPTVRAVTKAEGQYPSSNQNSSPSFFFSVGIPHGHTFVHATGAFNTPTRTKGSSPTLSGRSPTSRVERSSPSVPLRDSTWPHFRARHWRFQHTYEGKKAHPPP